MYFCCVVAMRYVTEMFVIEGVSGV